MLSEKNRQRQIERDRDQQQKKQYNDRLEQLKQMEKLKEMSYKNYYQMLMAGQQQHTENYVSPFGQRDSVIDTHINVQLSQGHKKAKQEQVERSRRMAAMKDQYRQELRHQIEEKTQLKNNERAEREKEKHQYERMARLPQEIEEFERMRRREQMYKYKEDLDRNRADKEMQRRRPSDSTPHINNKHNPLVNPLPFNVQNPYILKQMERNNTALTRNGSYLAGIGSSGLHETNK